MKYKKQVRNTIALGATTMADNYALGSFNNLPGIPLNNTYQIASASMNLTNIGNLANIGMNMMPKYKKRR